MNCPNCNDSMVLTRATDFGDDYHYCRNCKKELSELVVLESPTLDLPQTFSNMELAPDANCKHSKTTILYYGNHVCSDCGVVMNRTLQQLCCKHPNSMVGLDLNSYCTDCYLPLKVKSNTSDTVDSSATSCSQSSVLFGPGPGVLDPASVPTLGSRLASKDFHGGRLNHLWGLLDSLEKKLETLAEPKESPEES